ncbi:MULTISPECIES: glycosyltransferase [Sphingomonas]|uniref:Glycosyltransferase involved in cell wall biosynthesis n=1 Tax=Sphingomonas trueperi TaxID=53317 RepID=A0A7X5Y0C5_9SPHN|nr:MULTISPECIES: glycosyltransferase [Sphingomonas]NJB98709.1 glycosyltransferase involved in cell wall biosynthesis [Sphingomonas trueperi]
MSPHYSSGRIRVLTFLHSFAPGGVERVALRLVRHWRAMGVDAPLFLGREDGAMRDEFADVAYEMPRQPRRHQGGWETLWMILTLPAAIRRLRPDVLFVAGSTYTIVAVAMTLLLGRRCPPIVVKVSNDLARRDLNPLGRFFWRAWLRIQARCARSWVVMDEAMLPELPPVMAQRGHVVHDPAICAMQLLPERAQRPAGPRRFVAIGRLAPQKHFALMLRAFARAVQPGETLTIFGDGAERPMLEALAASLGIADRVRFAGHVADAPAHLHDYDVLLMSSRYEGVPAVVIEALAAGLAVVSTDCGAGLRSLLSQGRFGMIVPQNEALLAEAIRTAPCATPDRPALLASLRRFTIERSAQDYLALFVAAAEAHAARRPMPVEQEVPA